MMRLFAAALSALLWAAALVGVTAPAHAQGVSTGMTISQLLTQGFQLVTASSNGAQQFLYFSGVDKTGRKQIYACQVEFGTKGGFQGCLVLP
jgi:hypothetical protein